MTERRWHRKKIEREIGTERYAKMLVEKQRNSRRQMFQKGRG